MSYSLNEVDAMAKRATRGAGYSWGMAEEAGKAARWLCAHDIDGCAALVRLLRQTDGAEFSDTAWAANGGSMCPLLTGAAIADGAYGLKGDAGRCGATIEPILLLPFVAIAARQIGGALTLSCAETSAVTDGINLSLQSDFPGRVEVVTVGLGGDVSTAQTLKTRAWPEPETWAALDQFAQRTFAPATEESRRKGAGSGLSDND